MFITKKPMGFLYLVILERNYQIYGTNVSLDLLSERSLHQLSMVCAALIHCAAKKAAVFPPTSFPGFSPTCPRQVGEKPGNEVVFLSRLGSKTKAFKTNCRRCLDIG